MSTSHARTGAALAAVSLRRGWAVRGVRDEDADALVALIAGVFAEYPGCVFDADGVDADLATWSSHLGRAGGEGWVVTDGDGGVVACVGVAPVDDDTVELKRLYVAAPARRRGMGAALVALVEAWALDHDRRRVELWSDTRFADAHRLYERAGYVDDGSRRDLHDPSDTTESHWTRTI